MPWRLPLDDDNARAYPLGAAHGDDGAAHRAGGRLDVRRRCRARRSPVRPRLHDRVVPAAPAHGYRSEEHTSELQSLMRISYAVFCLKKKKNNKQTIKLQEHK